MKKSFTFYLLIALATAFILSSCHHNMSVTKRRYNKGYYVHHNANKHHDAAANNTEKVKAPKAEKPMMVAPKAEAVTVAAEEKTASEAPAKAVTASNAAKKEKHTAAQPAIKNNMVYTSRPVDLSAKRSFKAINNQVISQKAAAEDGLSLFWIVILVLLILWALGLIGGLGGIVYILLIVALILLILWLLRIV